mgnify:CR=1 FL=1
MSNVRPDPICSSESTVKPGVNEASEKLSEMDNQMNPSTATSMANSDPIISPKRDENLTRSIFPTLLAGAAAGYIILIGIDFNAWIIWLAGVGLLGWSLISRSRISALSTVAASIFAAIVSPQIFSGIPLALTVTVLALLGASFCWMIINKAGRKSSSIEPTVDQPAVTTENHSRRSTYVDRGIVGGLMYTRTHPTLTVSFVVRRYGTGSKGQPLPIISVRWQGWKLEGSIEEGDEVAFHNAPAEYQINSPKAIFNLTQQGDVRMLPLSEDPDFRFQNAVQIALKLFAFFAVIALWIFMWASH